MFAAGAHAYLFKNADEEELFETINKVSIGEKYVIKSIVNIPNKAKVEERANLTHREIDIAKHIMNGMTNPEIVEKLYLSVRTVETHRKSILAKLNLIKHCISCKILN